MNDERTQVWDKLPDETDKAYRAFCTYLLLGPGRSIDAAYHSTKSEPKKHQRAPGHWKKWSTEHNWVERSGEWDAHCYEQALSSQADSLAQLASIATEASIYAARQIRDRLKPGEKSIPVDLGDITKALNATTNALHKIATLTGQGQPTPQDDDYEYDHPWFTSDEAPDSEQEEDHPPDLRT